MMFTDGSRLLVECVTAQAVVGIAQQAFGPGVTAREQEVAARWELASRRSEQTLEAACGGEASGVLSQPDSGCCSVNDQDLEGGDTRHGALSVRDIALSTSGGATATRDSALSVRDTALSTGGNAGATVASSKGGVVTLVGKSLVRTDGARGAVALTVEVVGKARLANILEVGRRPS